MTKYQKAVNLKIRKISDKQLYLREVATIKKYGNSYKLTLHKASRETGWEDADEWAQLERKIKNVTKLSNNISRAKAKIYEYAMCNDWDYFITCTLDQK